MCDMRFATQGQLWFPCMLLQHFTALSAGRGGPLNATSRSSQSTDRFLCCVVLLLLLLLLLLPPAG
jgi:hypothetical protein